MRKHFRIIFFMLGLAFTGESLGLFFSNFGRLPGLICLFLYILTLDINSIKLKKTYAILLISIILTGVICAPTPIIACGFILLLPLFLSDNIVLFGSSLVYFLYLSISTCIPTFYHIEHFISTGLNTLFKNIGINMNLSPSAFGFDVLSLSLSYTLLPIIKREKQSSTKQIIKAFIIPVVWVLLFFSFFLFYNLFSVWYYKLPHEHGITYKSIFIYLAGLFLPMNGQSLLLIWLVLPISLLLKRCTVMEDCQLPGSMSKFKKTVLGVSFIIPLTILMVFLYFPNSRNPFPENKQKLWIYETGMDFTTRPDETVFGLNNGLFSLFNDYMADIGFETAYTSDLSRPSSENKDILVLMNPNGSIEPSQKLKLKAFIENGGRLLALGDHTQMFGLENDFFMFLSEMNISFKFDTAIYFRELWKKCLESPFFTLDRILKKDYLTTSIVQGASLDIKYPAYPLIIGRYGWSDEGDLNNSSGFLGDRAYQPNEETGDLVLAAARNLGKGKIIAFGDTSFIQNSPLSFSYPLMQSVLSHLNESSGSFHLMKLIPFGFMLFSVLILAFIPLDFKKSIAAIILVFITVNWIASITAPEKVFFKVPEKKSITRAGIDRSLFNEFGQGDWDYDNRGIGGLKNGVIRQHMLPYGIYTLDDNLKTLDYLFIMSPNKKISGNSTKKILEFVQNGGKLILSAGYEHKEASEILLKHIGIDIKNIPLSFLAGTDTNQELRFISAWPLKIEEGVQCEVICHTTQDNYPLIVSFKKGKGEIIVIGDSYFFENRNLEEGYTFYQNNVLFFQDYILTEKEEP